MKKKSLLLLAIGVSVSPVIFAGYSGVGEMRPSASNDWQGNMPTVSSGHCGGTPMSAYKPMESNVRGALPNGPDATIPTTIAFAGPVPPQGQMPGIAAPNQMPPMPYQPLAQQPAPQMPQAPSQFPPAGSMPQPGR